MTVLIRNGWLIICDEKGTELKKGNVLIKMGRIACVSEKNIQETEPVRCVIDATGKVVIPGFVNSHTHSYANLVKSASKNLPLESWMLYIREQGNSMDPDDVYYNVLLGVIEMLRTGTTTCVDHLAKDYSGLNSAMMAYEKSGMRAVVAPMISDKRYLRTLPLDMNNVPRKFLYDEPVKSRSLIDITTKLYKAWHGKHDRLRVMFGPSGPQRCSDGLLVECSRLAEEYDTGFHTHLLETRIQAETGRMFYGKPMVSHLDEIGCLNRRSSLVHGVWLTEEEAKLVAKRDAVIIHDPASNLRLGSGIAPVNLYRKLGLKVALATDGANAGGNLNMFESMKLAAILHNPSEPNHKYWISPLDVLRMATYNGARAVGIENEVGSLEKGKIADIVILDPKKSPAMIPLRNPVAQIVYGESGLSIDTVIVQGRIVLDQGKIKTFDEEEVYSEAEKRAQKVIERSFTKLSMLDEQANFLSEALFKVRKPSQAEGIGLHS